MSTQEREACAASVRRARRALRPDVHAVLVAQNQRLAPSAARERHLEALRTGAAVVVTGQQVGLFLGPLYTLYKAASAICLARELAAATGEPVVPMFWLQTEDHDLVEIARAGMPGATLAVPADLDNRISIAHLALPPEVAHCIEAIAGSLGDGPNATQHLARLRRHYVPGAGWAHAFAGVLAELFAPEGLVVIDPRDPVLAAATAHVHARALDDTARIASALVARGAELTGAQVHVRADSPLSFFHPEGSRGRRVRLAATGDDFSELGTGARHGRRALHAALAADPLQFSTSALLRPIVQDVLLPTAAYVGGPAEVAYLAQVAPLYPLFDLAPPRVVGRARFLYVDRRMSALLERLGLAAHEVSAPEVDLLARLAPPEPARDLTPVLARLDELTMDLGSDPAVARARAKTRGSVERSLGKLARTIERAALYRNGERVSALRRLRDRLAPGGHPQERELCLSAFAAEDGDRAFVERVLAAVDPFTPQLKELR